MQNKDGSICGHTFDPEEWETNLPEVESDLEDEWICHHDSHPEADVCVFHMSTDMRDDLDISNQQIVDCLLKEINKTGPESKAFIDATFDTVDLRDKIISPPDNRTLDLRHASFEGKLLLEDATVTNDITFHGSEFQQVWMNGVKFEDEANWYGCEFNGTVKADSATFGGKILFARSRFQYGVRLRNSPTFEAKAIFSGAFFDSYLDITGGYFESLAYFRDVNIHKANFNNTTFSESARFGDAVFEEKAKFTEAVFQGQTYFGKKDRDEERDAASFECQANFSGVTVNSTMGFVDTEFRRQEEVVDQISSADVLFDRLTCTGILEFDPVVSDEQILRVDFTEARICEGKLGQPTDGTALYDFQRAKIGDIESTSDTHDKSALDAVRFIECDFDGFDFSQYRPALEPDYQIHTFSEIASVPENDLSPVVKETTFQKAKTGADNIGDNRAASEFFIREMRARKSRLAEQLGQQETRREWIEQRLRYETNRFFGATANYGESASRVFVTSIAIILGYSGVYGVLYTVLGGKPYSSAPPVIEYFLLSLVSFTGLVHGGGATVDNWFIRLVTATEAFAGAFLIALFLFALTRSIYR